jgi:hypothetical protein
LESNFAYLPSIGKMLRVKQLIRVYLLKHNLILMPFMTNIEQAKNSSGVVFKLNSRVKRANSERAPGTIEEFSSETTTSTTNLAKAESKRDNRIMVKVLWDNGTLSYVTPEALELAE